VISNLREMEENELLTRKVYPEVPPRVEYTLTDIGYSLKPLLDDMENFGLQWNYTSYDDDDDDFQEVSEAELNELKAKGLWTLS